MGDTDPRVRALVVAQMAATAIGFQAAQGMIAVTEGNGAPGVLAFGRAMVRVLAKLDPRTDQLDDAIGLAVAAETPSSSCVEVFQLVRAVMAHPDCDDEAQRSLARVIAEVKRELTGGSSASPSIAMREVCEDLDDLAAQHRQARGGPADSWDAMRWPTVAGVLPAEVSYLYDALRIRVVKVHVDKAGDALGTQAIALSALAKRLP